MTYNDPSKKRKKEVSILLSAIISIGAITVLSLISVFIVASEVVYGQQTNTTTVIMVRGAQSPSNEQFYNPAEVTVSQGSTIIWKNEDTAIHTAYSGKDATPDGKFETSLVSPGQSSKPITMPSEPGQYPYFCTLHPWMTGTVTVS